jgi:hypothetical protein
MQIAVSGNKGVTKNVLVYFIFLIAALLLFWPILHKNFASDDFSVLYRIVHEKKFFTQDFFRPLSDLSLYVSYLTGGFNPFYYNTVNVIIHASCAFLLYRFCLLNNFVPTVSLPFFAWFTAILFLIYPYHNEAIIWAIGRGIVLSGFFGFLSLLVVFTHISSRKKYLLSYLFYFAGLFGYETILALPLIILILLYSKDKSLIKLLPVAGGYLITLLAGITIRILLSGTAQSSYGSKIFSSSPDGYAIKLLKAAGRLFLPPAQSSLLLGVCFILLVLAIGLAVIMIVRKRNKQTGDFIKISGITVLSCIIPVMFGLSTKTYEGDRIFYFPSFFLCIWIAYLLSLLQNKMKYGASVVVAVYFLFFFYQSVIIWKRSGTAVQGIISFAGNIKHTGNVYLLNMPEEYNGAPVFRNGFREALMINHIDTTGIRVINYFTTEYALKMPGLIKPLNQWPYQVIYPAAIISGDTIMARVHTDMHVHDSVHVQFNRGDKIYYWNKEAFVLLQDPF